MSPLEPAPEFSRILPVDQVGAAGVDRRVAASAAERAALAQRFELSSLDRLEASMHVRRRAGALVEVTGQLEAELAQPCVVTLEPVPARITEPFRLVFSPDLPDSGTEIVVDEAEDGPEPMMGNQLDLGEVVAQQLGLSLDPYPRATGVKVDDEIGGHTGSGSATTSPFARLAELRPKPGQG